MDKKRKEEFRTSRTSWKFFERVFNKAHGDDLSDVARAMRLGELDFRVSLEILKEIQFLNDKS